MLVVDHLSFDWELESPDKRAFSHFLISSGIRHSFSTDLHTEGLKILYNDRYGSCAAHNKILDFTRRKRAPEI